MKLKIDTESLKIISNIVIECGLTQQIAAQIFNNIGTVSSEYTELCTALHSSCDKLLADIGKLKSIIPTV